MSRDISFRRLGADPFLSRHSAQLVERALRLPRVVLLRSKVLFPFRV